MDNYIGTESIPLVLNKQNRTIDDLLSSLGLFGVTRLMASLENNMYEFHYHQQADWSEDMNFEIPVYNQMVKSTASLFNIPIHVRTELWKCVARDLEYRSPDLKKRLRNGSISISLDNRFYLDTLTIGDYIYDRMMKFLVNNGYDIKKVLSRN